MKIQFLYAAGVVLLSVFSAVTLHADVTMPNIFNSNMVLQREKDVPVWGWSSPGEKISIKFMAQNLQTTADASGKWQTKLAPMSAGGPFKMEVSGKNNTLVFKNVLVGEVWLCSGQSNMQWPVKKSLNPELETVNANHPEIRLFYVPRLMSNLPQTNVNAQWQVCSPQTIVEFSATAYFFGREISKNLNVPVGLINASWDSTRICPWTPTTGYKAVPSLREIAKIVNDKIAKYQKILIGSSNSASYKTAKTEKMSEILPFDNNESPTVLYNAMIHPLVPLAIRGTIWYQGEANRGEGMLYFNKMQALINGWRSVFRNEDMPFYFAQLAPNDYGNNAEALPEIWEAQVASLSIPNTGMAVTMDIGDVKDIHPRNKQEVGRRLALQALNKTYGRKNIICDSPLFDELKLDGNKAVVTFENAVELKTRDGKAPDWFEICGEDMAYKKANATIERNKVILSADGIEKICSVRFAWHQLAEPNLINEAGLPASAFRAGRQLVAGEFRNQEKILSQIHKDKGFKPVLELDPIRPLMAGGVKVTYTSDKRSEISGSINRIAYYLELIKPDGSTDYVFVAMDPFTQDLSKIGIPDLDSKAIFQQRISNMVVISNVPGIKNGTFPEGGNIEFWGTNYGQTSAADIPGSATAIYGYGDAPTSNGDYGSMQIHNYKEKQTLFAYNNWKSGSAADLGIGNAPYGRQQDWTYLQNAGKYAAGKLLVLVQQTQ
jgi:sialate O-acetylesterase